DAIKVRADFNPIFLELDNDAQIDTLMEILSQEVDPTPEILVLQLLVAHMLDDMKEAVLTRLNIEEGYETVLTLIEQGDDTPEQVN
ncbi:MAG: hypothetical protein HOM11_02775, partial [Methylococcales bacterium]|nr:hypothetical protein [Methylococcales bacterium]